MYFSQLSANLEISLYDKGSKSSIIILCVCTHQGHVQDLKKGGADRADHTQKLELSRAHTPCAASASRSTSARFSVYIRTLQYIVPIDDLYLHSMLGYAHVHKAYQGRIQNILKEGYYCTVACENFKPCPLYGKTTHISIVLERNPSALVVQCSRSVFERIFFWSKLRWAKAAFFLVRTVAKEGGLAYLL
jgi:hypothetical protein